MINLRYLLHPSSCGCFCLRYIMKKRIKINGYMSLFEMKEEFVRNNYYCFCCRVKSLENIKCLCITLMKMKNSFHYVIIINVDERFVYVYDPLFLFVRKVKKDKFMTKWSKICLFYRKI